MSLRPPKISDRNKRWMHIGENRERKIQPEYHLIVSEGTCTEPAYFQSIKNIINEQYREKIQLHIHGEGDNTLNLFERARQLVPQNPNGYRHVWIVYDVDDFPADRVDQVVTLCQQYSTEETEYHPIWSNQCVEVWFLLHFCYLQADIPREEYSSKLSEWLTNLGYGGYQKNRNDMYHILRPYMDTAIRNAKKLEELHKGYAPSQAAPGTKMYELLEKLKPYLPNV